MHTPRQTTGGDGQHDVRSERQRSVARGQWYADPFEKADERWWDGTKWTSHVRRGPAGGWPEESPRREPALSASGFAGDPAYEDPPPAQADWPPEFAAWDS